MTNLTPETEAAFYDVLTSKTDVSEFEKWVYLTPSLEEELPPDIYLELISLDFKSRYLRNDLEKLLSPLVDFPKFETRRIKDILSSVIEKEADCIDSIRVLYDLYCDGYGFLQALGMNYGLLVACSEVLGFEGEFEDLPQKGKEFILGKIYPDIIPGAKRLLHSLENGEIRIFGKVNDFGAFQFEDLRKG